MVKFLLDSNIFIQAKNFHYKLEFCEGFWSWIEMAHTNGLVCSIKKVKAELALGKPGDPARLWADAMPPNFFLDDDQDGSLMTHYGKVISKISSSIHYTQAAKNEFAEYTRADAFLIAAALRHNAVVVTHEKGNPDQKKRVPIPDGGLLLGVQSLTIFELLEKHAHKPNFTFKP